MWTKGVYAMNRDGDDVDRECIKECDPSNLTCFCLAGGIEKVYEGNAHAAVEARLAGVIRSLFGNRIKLRQRPHISDETAITVFNDDEKTTIQEIRKVVKIANV